MTTLIALWLIVLILAARGATHLADIERDLAFLWRRP